MKCLHINIHNPDGFLGSTERWWYDDDATIPNRKEVLDDYFCQHMIKQGYIIGNIYTTKSIESKLKYCNEIDESFKDMEVAQGSITLVPCAVK